MKKQKKKNNKKWLLYVVAFLLPIIISSIGFLCCLKQSQSGDLYPGFGDFQVQYIPLFTYLKNVIQGNASFIYSFSKGLGGGMISTNAYYLMSPLNLLVGLVPISNVPMMMLGIIILKFGLAGLFSYIFLSSFFKKKDYRLIIFSTCYALSAYAVNYYFCLMWLDALYMLPLILLGIRKLVEGKSSLMYIICLLYTIICNYYVGYMVCIFACLYFLYEIIIQKIYKDKKQLLKISLKFILSSLLSGMMSMILLIPMAIDLSNTARSIGSYEGDYTLENVSNNFNFIQLLYRLLIGSHGAYLIENYTVINIYFGMVVLPLLYFYFVNKDIEKREKIFSGAMVTLFLLSYSIKYIDYIWHGFAFPNGLNYRFSFLFIFYFIIISCRSFLNLKSISKKHYIAFFAVFLLLMNLLMLNGYNDKYIQIYVSTFCVGLYLILMYVMNHVDLNKAQKIEVPCIFIALIVGELLFNIYFSLNKYFEYTVEEYNDYSKIHSEKIEKYKSKENEFYRMNQDEYFVSNPGLLFDYNGMQSFLSTMNTKDLTFLSANGYLTNGISLVYTSNSHVLFDSILGVKYLISSTESCNSYEKVDSFEYSKYIGLFYNTIMEEHSICYNDMAMPIGFMIDKDWNTYGSDIDDFSYLAVSESVVNSMLENSYEYYEKYDSVKINDYEYTVTLDDKNRFYITYMYPVAPENLHIYINDELMYWFGYPERLVMVENKYKGETINVRFEFDNLAEALIENVGFYSENTENIKKATDELKENSFEIEKLTDTYIKGTVTATEEKNTLFFSIPYEDGWQVYVDGKKASKKILYEAFVGLELTPGEHTIELKYSIPGLKLGVSISGISLVLTIIYIYIEQKKRKESQIMLEK